MTRTSSIVQGSTDILLVWLDDNINENDTDYQETMNKFRQVVNIVDSFTDADECTEFLLDLNNEEVFMVISGSLGRRLISQVHDIFRIKWIFVFCCDRALHEQWTKEWTKIKGVFTDISSLCHALKQASEEHKKNLVSMATRRANSERYFSFGTVDQLDPSFMYTQILKEILLSIKFEQKHFQEFIHYCRELFVNNARELHAIEEFEKTYSSDKAIWWHNRECFLYRTVSRSLRMVQVDAIIKMGFYICDLNRLLKELHSKEFQTRHRNDKLVVYRGQSVPKVVFEQLSKTKDGLLSFNQFLSTSKHKNVALSFVRKAETKSELVSILFVMTIDPSLPTIPFASIEGISCYPNEEEILFSMHSIFRIGDIKQIDPESRIFEVNLQLTSDTDADLQKLSDHLRKEICQHPNEWYQLCRLLIKMGQLDTAENIYERLLEETPDLREQGNLYHQIGSIKTEQGNYQEAITYFEKALVICEKTLLANHPHLASSYNNIGLAYGKIKEYSKALASHENALRIYEKIRPPNHPDFISTYNNMGLVYNDLKEYDKALSFHEKALKIRQETLPNNHPDLAMSYSNIGLVYGNLGEFSKALSFHERAVAIGQSSLPSNHPDLIRYRQNLDLARQK